MLVGSQSVACLTGAHNSPNTQDSHDDDCDDDLSQNGMIMMMMMMTVLTQASVETEQVLKKPGNSTLVTSSPEGRYDVAQVPQRSARPQVEKRHGPVSARVCG